MTADTQVLCVFEPHFTLVRRRVHLWGIVAAGACACDAAGQAAFSGLGLFDGPRPYTFPYAVSADGTTVVGEGGADHAAIPPSDVRAFRWTTAGLAALPPPLPSYDAAWRAYATSADGSVVVGDAEVNMESCAVCSPLQAFRWTAESGTIGLGGFPANTPWILGSYARGISADGVVVVGMSSGLTGSAPPTYIRASRWTEANGWDVFGPPVTETMFSAAYGVSADGETIVGVKHASFGAPAEAFVWTESSGIVGLGTLPGHASSAAQAVSADGGTAVGWSAPEGGNRRAVLWRPNGDIVDLGDLPGGMDSSSADGVSSDGSVVVGFSSTDAPGGTGFIWDQKHGMRQLHAVLTQEYGLDLQGWTLRARAITPDERTIVGSGINPEGQREGWIVRLGSPCAADWNTDGSLNSGDYFAFLDDFFAGQADFNGDGVVNSDDYFAFLESFFEGCP